MTPQAAPAVAGPDYTLNPDGSIPLSWPISKIQAYQASLQA